MTTNVQKFAKKYFQHLFRERNMDLILLQRLFVVLFEWLLLNDR